MTMVRPAPLALATLALSVALFAQVAVAATPLYQWLDANGNVIYGDSPPAVSAARRLGSEDPAPATAQPSPLPPPVLAGESPTPAPAVEGEGLDARDQALAAALAKLDAVMQQVSALSGQLPSPPSAPGPAAAPAQGSAPVASVAIAPTPVLGAQPLLEVAMPEAQPIESRLSARERDRSRWDAESLGQRRFLERLGRLKPERAADE
jgi:hypothetical protein